MAAKTFRTKGIVLRTDRLGEADRIITLLTIDQGIIRAVAKGVRRTSSRYGARLELFSVIDAQLLSGRNLDILTQVEVLYPFAQLIARDYDLYTAGAIIVETALQLFAEDDPDPSHYRLTLGALNALARRHHDPDLVLSAFLLRAMAQQGWAPQLGVCGNCGTNLNLNFFSVPQGCSICDDCATIEAMDLPRPGSQIAAALLRGDWDLAETAARQTQKEIAHLATTYAQWHLERKLKSVPVRQHGRTS
ncbi:DNA repair protein RecO [Boudabousia tangfeifanii]|uniref:DNA repair protein RecO n=1 Tax=Boudabousia tangfeifanii TaxID=1912795 RepID=A0A1D9MKZ4_9ACTO|nr:DNA repair protein RecO [Boudabousia tangfeifanii]AOZ72908.1 DNA repair protein RecO [Boudabousia tangfeifanii]